MSTQTSKVAPRVAAHDSSLVVLAERQRLVEEANMKLLDAVAQARKGGASWQEIAERLGLSSRHTARARYASVLGETSETSSRKVRAA